MKLTIGEFQNSKPTGSLWSPADFVLVLVSGAGRGGAKIGGAAKFEVGYVAKQLRAKLAQLC